MVFYVYNKRQITVWTWVLLFFCLPAFLVPAQTPPSVGRAPQKLISLNFRDAPLDQVLDFYGELTGRTMIKAPNVNATITLRGQTRLTEEEALKAITSILAMNNISLVPMGEKFFKVVQIASARQEGMELEFFDPEAAQDSDRLVSQLITLDFIEISEAQPVVQGLLHGYGKIQALERINSLLVTDTENNLQRIMEILDFIDQPVSTRVETRIYEIQYAEAGKIGSSLKELVQESAQKEEKETVEAPKAATPPGVIRARSKQAANRAEVLSAAELAQRGIIQGKVKIITDERTNILIVISEPENFVFFDKIVAVLDRPVEPEIEVKVVALEYADAEEISGILNEFIGAATKKDGPSGSGEGKAGDGEGGSTALEQFIKQRADSRVASTDEGTASIGELSEKTKILADTRSNALLLMGRKADISALMEVIDQLDIMLSQVLIEAVILEVGLSESFEYGIDWLQRSLTAYNVENRGPGGGVKVRQPVMSFGGGQRLSEGTTFLDGSQITRDISLSPGALTYFTTFFDFNIDAVLRLAAGNSDTKILSTPVILTTDNTEAKIVVGEERPVVTSSSTTSAGEQRSTYEYKNIGINLTVTPRINPQGYVVMEIAQTVDNVGDETVIDGNSVPIITKRELNASVSVPSKSTIVLGGLISNDRRLGRAKVPLLGDIPLLGALFRSDSRSKTRRELMILITPYVMESPMDSYRLTERLHNATSAREIVWPENWSESPLATLPPERIREIRKQKKKEKQLELRMKLDVPARSPAQSSKPEADLPEKEPAGPEADIQPALEADDPTAWVTEEFEQ